MEGLSDECKLPTRTALARAGRRLSRQQLWRHFGLDAGSHPWLVTGEEPYPRLEKVAIRRDPACVPQRAGIGRRIRLARALLFEDLGAQVDALIADEDAIRTRDEPPVPV
jgi:hypothetical protein